MPVEVVQSTWHDVDLHGGVCSDGTQCHDSDTSFDWKQGWSIMGPALGEDSDTALSMQMVEHIFEHRGVVDFLSVHERPWLANAFSHRFFVSEWLAKPYRFIVDHSLDLSIAQVVLQAKQGLCSESARGLNRNPFWLHGNKFHQCWVVFIIGNPQSNCRVHRLQIILSPSHGNRSGPRPKQFHILVLLHRTLCCDKTCLSGTGTGNLPGLRHH